MSVVVAVSAALLWLTWWWGRRALTPAAFIGAAPFFGGWRWHITPALLLPLGVLMLAVAGADRARHLDWQWFVGTAVLTGLAWSASLAAAVGGASQFTAELRSGVDYTGGVGAVGSHPGHYLATYVRSITASTGSAPSLRGYPIHVQGHPPGAVLSVWALTRLGLSPTAASIVLILLGQALVIVAVLTVARLFVAESLVRRAAALLVLAPAALWSHSLDTWFAGLGAVAVAASVVAIERAHDDRPWLLSAAVAGVAFGAVALSSYGLVLLGLVPLTLAVARRCIRAIAPMAVVAGVVAAVPAAWGFWWFDGLRATRHQYAVTVARDRPYGYFLVADLVVVLIALGPVVVASLVALRGPAGQRARTRPLAAVVVGALLAVVAADLSGMAKAEVERIWQPFFPWFALALLAWPTLLDGPHRRRGLLMVQGAGAIALAASLWTLW